MSFVELYSPNYLRELSPYFEVIHNGAALPRRLQKLVQSLSIAEEEGKAAQATLVIDDTTGEFLDSPFINYGDVVSLRCGYVEEFEERGPFDVADTDDQLRGSGVLWTIKLVASNKLSRTSTRRVYRTGTLRSVIEEVLSRSDVQLETDELLDDLVDEENPVVQSGETDLMFLRRLATSFGLYATAVQGKLFVTSSVPRAKTGRFLLQYNSATASVAKLKMKRAKPRAHNVPLKNATGKICDVKDLIAPRGPKVDQAAEDGFFGKGIKGLDEIAVCAKASVTPEATPGNSQAPAPSVTGVPEVDAAIQQMNINEFGEVIVSSVGSGSIDDAVSLLTKGLAADASANEPGNPAPMTPDSKPESEKKVAQRKEWRAGKLEGMSADLKLGTIFPRPTMELELVGAGQTRDGKYRVTKVQHGWRSGYTTSLECKRGWKEAPKKPDVPPDDTRWLDRVPDQAPGATQPEEPKPGRGTFITVNGSGEAVVE